RSKRDWCSDVCSPDLMTAALGRLVLLGGVAVGVLMNSFGGSGEPEPEPESVVAEPTSTTTEETSVEPEPMTCNVEETDGKLVTKIGRASCRERERSAR